MATTGTNLGFFFSQFAGSHNKYVNGQIGRLLGAKYESMQKGICIKLK